MPVLQEQSPQFKVQTLSHPNKKKEKKMRQNNERSEKKSVILEFYSVIFSILNVSPLKDTFLGPPIYTHQEGYVLIFHSFYHPSWLFWKSR
jgi:hypothetical protein